MHALYNNSVVFDYLVNHKTFRKSVLRTKCIFHGRVMAVSRRPPTAEAIPGQSMWDF
jgi:hypothetical protein